MFNNFRAVDRIGGQESDSLRQSDRVGHLFGHMVAFLVFRTCSLSFLHLYSTTDCGECQGGNFVKFLLQGCGLWARTTLTPLSDYHPKEPHERREQSRTVLGPAGRYHSTWASSPLEHFYYTTIQGFCQVFFKKFF